MSCPYQRWSKYCAWRILHDTKEREKNVGVHFTLTCNVCPFTTTSSILNDRVVTRRYTGKSEWLLVWKKYSQRCSTKIVRNDRGCWSSAIYREPYKDPTHFCTRTFASPPLNVNRPYLCPFPLQNFNSNSRKLSHPSTPEECTRFSALSKLLRDQFNHSYLLYVSLITQCLLTSFTKKKFYQFHDTWWGLQRNTASTTGIANNQITDSIFLQHRRLVDVDNVLWPLSPSHRKLGVGSDQ